jgi:dihydroorotate dehydrogenase electron transfer subunit
VSDRTLAPFERRRCEVVGNRATGGYRIVSVADPEGPEPQAGQFYMLAAAVGWGGDTGRPFLPRAFSVAAAERGPRGLRLDFLGEVVGPGTEVLMELAEGDGMWVTGPLGRPFAMPGGISAGAAGAILVGGGIGIAPLAILRRSLARAGVPQRVLLGFRDEEHSGGVDELFGSEREAAQGEGEAGSAGPGPDAKSEVCPEVRLASEDGHAGHRGYVTDLLAVMLAGDDGSSAVVYACGPPAMLEAVRSLCDERGVPAELAMESPMACGYGACFGCAVPLTEGGYMRLCVDGPVVRASEIETALVAGAGHR